MDVSGQGGLTPGETQRHLFREVLVVNGHVRDAGGGDLQIDGGHRRFRADLHARCIGRQRQADVFHHRRFLARTPEIAVIQGRVQHHVGGFAAAFDRDIDAAIALRHVVEHPHLQVRRLHANPGAFRQPAGPDKHLHVRLSATGHREVERAPEQLVDPSQVRNAQLRQQIGINGCKHLSDWLLPQGPDDAPEPLIPGPVGNRDREVPFREHQRRVPVRRNLFRCGCQTGVEKLQVTSGDIQAGSLRCPARGLQAQVEAGDEPGILERQVGLIRYDTQIHVQAGGRYLCLTRQLACTTVQRDGPLLREQVLVGCQVRNSHPRDSDHHPGGAVFALLVQQDAIVPLDLQREVLPSDKRTRIVRMEGLHGTEGHSKSQALRGVVTHGDGDVARALHQVRSRIQDEFGCRNGHVRPGDEVAPVIVEAPAPHTLSIHLHAVEPRQVNVEKIEAVHRQVQFHVRGEETQGFHPLVLGRNERRETEVPRQGPSALDRRLVVDRQGIHDDVRGAFIQGEGPAPRGITQQRRGQLAGHGTPHLEDPDLVAATRADIRDFDGPSPPLFLFLRSGRGLGVAPLDGRKEGLDGRVVLVWPGSRTQPEVHVRRVDTADVYRLGHEGKQGHGRRGARYVRLPLLRRCLAIG